MFYFTCRLSHSHKKWKDSLEGSLLRVLFVAELEFLKILVPMLTLSTSNVKLKVMGNQSNCIIYVSNFLEPSSIFIFILLYSY